MNNLKLKLNGNYAAARRQNRLNSQRFLCMDYLTNFACSFLLVSFRELLHMNQNGHLVLEPLVFAEC